ncbi:MAG: hypothetical protein GQ537_05445 [Gammaproteobacteria bacterium]|nr:hypothetical protein [Gammaproteobacteria bacterium]
MRLLEFSHDKGGANPQHALNPQNLPPAAIKTVKASIKPDSNALVNINLDQPGKIIPLAARPTTQTARRKPIDLEHLQQRLEILEQRMRERAQKHGKQTSNQDLEKLKQRLKLLERSINNELWAAKQREYTMLEMLARPTLKMAVLQKMTAFRSKTLPAAGCWLKTASGQWWSDNQPGWWHKVASAWQQSLEQARR